MSQDGRQGDPDSKEEPPQKKASCGVITLIVLACLLPPLGVTGALAKYGVRRHLTLARAAEAKETVQRIAQGMVGAYERNGRMCGSGSPVPPTIPAGKAYQPSLAAGEDFQKGSATAGWPCMKLSMVGPIHYQYEVRVGGNYKSVALGGYDPGAGGFEVSAEGDLDGDGVTSLFTYIGVVNPRTKTISLSAQLHIVDEDE